MPIRVYKNDYFDAIDVVLANLLFGLNLAFFTEIPVAPLPKWCTFAMVLSASLHSTSRRKRIAFTSRTR